MTSDATGASERHEDRGAVGSPVQRPVGRWWHRLWPRNTLGAREEAIIESVDLITLSTRQLRAENERLRKKVRAQRAELHRLNKAHAAMWAGSRFTVFAQEKARLQREQKPAPSRPKHACDDPACAVCGHPWAL